MTPDHVRAQLDLSLRGIGIAVESRDELAELKLRCKAILRLFVICDPAQLARQRVRHAQLVERLREPYYLLVEAGNVVTTAIAEGRFADAEVAVDDYGRWVEVNGQPDTGYGIQMFSIRREQGRLAELRPMLELGARIQGDTAWGPGLAAVYAEVGMVAEASAMLDRLALDGLASLPRDTLLAGVLSYLADAAHTTGHEAIARAALELLGPYAGLMVCVPGLVCYGAADRYIGKLHEVLGQPAKAKSHFEVALELDERTGWACWIAHSRYALGRHLVRFGQRGRGHTRRRPTGSSSCRSRCARYELARRTLRRGVALRLRRRRGGCPTHRGHHRT